MGEAQYFDSTLVQVVEYIEDNFYDKDIYINAYEIDRPDMYIVLALGTTPDEFSEVIYAEKIFLQR